MAIRRHTSDASPGRVLTGLLSGEPQTFMFALLAIAQLLWIALLTYGIWFAAT